MKEKATDAPVGGVADLIRQCSELTLKMRTMELLLARHDKALYQEYMAEINAPRGGERL